ncbi:glycosyltransferase family 2 protein [Rhodoferax sp. 4810]|uniref:Glycosyltransferase family 2 protein n=1 Tax=Thiospirillum jenense TaxID=1653858 RepID=A0A839HCT3_9GAMM|nr:glycosyltransferase family 2 protein [Thiospirillum jenense]MBB1073049.1 glycosyltransferase family 2 protein [Rhodoferax jenense]MBB1124997.1 glycosyltransferase family 2 protein [Thiospirillum jenense]
MFKNDLTHPISVVTCRPELAVIIPTYNEVDNVVPIITALENALVGIEWELIIVDDDSPDETAMQVRILACHNPRVRVLQRLGRRGLASACIEGMLVTTAPFLAIMDADLQHDENLLPTMLMRLKQAPLDIVIGSRYVNGGTVGEWNKQRQKMSQFASQFAHSLIHAKLHDPMSGFFMLRAEVFHLSVRKLSGVGFKLLLDLFASHPETLRFEELPYQFRTRQNGTSKLESAVLWEYLLMLLQKFTGNWLPVRFISFIFIGASGVLIHLCVLWLLYKSLATSFIVGQSVATLVAMTTNFFFNNLLTYRDMRLRGKQLIRGWFSFILACSVGAIANVGVANYLVQAHSWWMLSAIAGIIVGAVWNYAVTAVYTWNKPR